MKKKITRNDQHFLSFNDFILSTRTYTQCIEKRYGSVTIARRRTENIYSDTNNNNQLSVTSAQLRLNSHSSLIHFFHCIAIAATLSSAFNVYDHHESSQQRAWKSTELRSFFLLSFAAFLLMNLWFFF